MRASPPPSPFAFATLPDDARGRVVYQSPTAVTLSTYFLGGVETDSSLASAETGNAMALDNLANVTREELLQKITWDLAPTEWAQCSEALVAQGAVLPCRTGDLPQRCIHGLEQCDTTEENMRAPWMELNLHEGKPSDRDYYFFALEVSLPTHPELGALFFQTAQGVSEDRGDVTNRFYELEVFDTHHNPLRTQCKPHFKQSTDFYTAGMTYFQYVCLEALAEDDAYMAMRDVRYVRLTLLGEHRMLWLMSTRALYGVGRRQLRNGLLLPAGLARTKGAPLPGRTRQRGRPARRGERRAVVGLQVGASAGCVASTGGVFHLL